MSEDGGKSQLKGLLGVDQELPRIIGVITKA
jgi:hypothetical protein